MKLNPIITTLLITSLLLGSPFVWGAEVSKVPHIEEIQIVDSNGVDWTGKTLVAGGIYTINFKLVIEVNQPGNSVTISTNLLKVGDRFWELKNDFAGIDTESWKPGVNSFEADIIKGSANLVLRGKVPSDVTIINLENNVQLHKEQNVVILTVSQSTNNEILDFHESVITDPDIMDFDSRFNAATQTLENSLVDTRFRDFYNDMLNQILDLRRAGYLNHANSILHVLPESSEFIDPPQTGQYFMISTVGLAIITILFAFLWRKSKSGTSNVSGKINERTKELDLLLIKLRRIDKSMADDMLKIKEDIESIAKEG